MIFQTLKQIAVTTTLATVSSVLITPNVWAVTLYNISGTFNDDGTLYGSFSYDSVNKEYTNVNITTTGTEDFGSGSNYQIASIFGSDNGFSINDEEFNFLLDIVFNSSGLADQPRSIWLDTLTTEENFFDETLRTISSGKVTATVPENFSSYSIFLLLALLGIRFTAVKSKKEVTAHLDGVTRIGKNRSNKGFRI